MNYTTIILIDHNILKINKIQDYIIILSQVHIIITGLSWS